MDKEAMRFFGKGKTTEEALDNLKYSMKEQISARLEDTVRISQDSVIITPDLGLVAAACGCGCVCSGGAGTGAGAGG